MARWRFKFPKRKVPDGYIALPSSTYTGFALLRSNLKSSSEADVAKAVAYSGLLRRNMTRLEPMPPV